MTDAPPPLRLLVSDIDGTLVRHDKSLAPATIAAAGRLLAAGGAMTLISARPPSGILPLARQLGLAAPVAAFNGGSLVDIDGTVRCAHRLNPETGARAIAVTRAAGASAWVFADGRWHASDRTNPHIDRERLSAMVEPVFTDDFTALHGRIDKIVAVTDDSAAMTRIERDLKAKLGDAANVALSQPYYCDVTHPLANKGDGIAMLAAAIGLPLAAIAAIGDMPNDIPMLRRAAYGIAMGQAPDEVKRAARAETGDADDDGLAAAIDRLVIPALAPRSDQ